MFNVWETRKMTPKCPKCGMWLNSVDGELHQCPNGLIQGKELEK